MHIRTTLPRVEVTPAYRVKIARMLREYLHNGHLIGCRPYPVSFVDGTYVFDGHNDWFCCVDEDDSQVIEIRHRDSAAKTEALVNWILANNVGWKTITPQPT